MFRCWAGDCFFNVQIDEDSSIGNSWEVCYSFGSCYVPNCPSVFFDGNTINWLQYYCLIFSWCVFLFHNACGWSSRLGHIGVLEIFVIFHWDTLISVGFGSISRLKCFSSVLCRRLMQWCYYHCYYYKSNLLTLYIYDPRQRYRL